MMDVQIPHIAPAASSASTNTQGAPRLGQGGMKRESAGYGKSFSSELHDVHASKGSRHDIRDTQTDYDDDETSKFSDQPEPESSSTCRMSRCEARDGQSSDNVSTADHEDTNISTPSTVTDVTTQSVLLALIAQPVVKSDSQILTQPSPADQASTAMESVMPPVMEDGTSLPVTAADSSNLPQKTENAVTTAKPTDFAAAVPSEVILPAPVDPKVQTIDPPDNKQMLNSQVQPTPDTLPEIGKDTQADSPKPVTQPHDSTQMDAKAEPVILPKTQPFQTAELQDTGKTIAAQQIQRPEDKQPVAAEHPGQTREVPQPKEEADLKPMSAFSTGSQDPTNQDRNNDRESFGRDHRDRSTHEQIPTYFARTETTAPAAPSNSSLLVNGMDQRAFSSAPSAKLPADTNPAVTTPPVQPTDWMPGASANQTKSMVLELSQADLGRVNIRVAVNQDVVHTHISSDRSDMGQYLQSGQEKLQAALQTSGLDLGRFQVDIDRQSAGRSFQQPASQGQSHGRSPHEESHNQGQGREEFTREPSSRRGKVNLVA